MSEQFVYIGSRLDQDFQWPNVASSKSEVTDVLARLDARVRTYVVVGRHEGWSWLLESLGGMREQRRFRTRILGLSEMEHSWPIESILASRSETCVGRPPVILPNEALAEVLTDANRRDLCLGGSVDGRLGLLVVVRGDLDLLTVPLSAFDASGEGIEPDFADFEVIDHGQTLRFGIYEASFDAVLYEWDPEYRRRIGQLRREEERSFGASLRRLRLQRRLSREDFPGVSAKSIARIERGEVGRPRPDTLRKIADRLGVAPGDIQGF